MIYLHYGVQKRIPARDLFVIEYPTLKLNALAALQSAKQSRLEILLIGKPDK